MSASTDIEIWRDDKDNAYYVKMGRHGWLMDGADGLRCDITDDIMSLSHQQALRKFQRVADNFKRFFP